MERFWQIKSKSDNTEFLSMEKFNESIKKKKSNDQRLFSPFKESLDLFYLCLLIGLKYKVIVDSSSCLYKYFSSLIVSEKLICKH